MTIIICHNKLPGRKWRWRPLKWIESVVDVTLGRDGPENLRILKRPFNWVSTLKHAARFFRSKKQIILGLYRQRWVEILNTSRCTARMVGGLHRMVSIGFYDLCLSTRVVEDWNQKLINPFVSETTEFTYICICIITVIIDNFMNIQYHLTWTGSFRKIDII